MPSCTANGSELRNRGGPATLTETGARVRGYVIVAEPGKRTRRID